jgi:hypothetical protein
MNDNTQDEPQRKVFITKEAFRNMITHILRFGSEVLQRKYEVFGVLIGKEKEGESKDLIVNKAIPLTHGDQIRLNQDDVLLEKLSQIKEEYHSRELKLIGSYISHIDEGLSFRERDINNHLLFQDKENPDNFCIIFNPSLIKKKEGFGLKIYLLDDFNLGIRSSYHQIPYEIEKPNSLNYFRWVQKFVEDYQKQNPVLIYEKEELSESKQGDYQEIPMDKGDFAEDLFNLSRFQRVNTEFGTTIKEIFNQQFEPWTQEINEAALSGNEALLETIIQINSNISRATNRFQNRFQGELDEILNSFESSLLAELNNANNECNKISDQINDRYSKIRSTLIEKVKVRLTNTYQHFRKEINEISEKSEVQKKNLQKFAEQIEMIPNITNELSNQMDESLENVKAKIKDLLEHSMNEKLALIGELETESEKLEKSYLTLKTQIKEKIKKIKEL